MLHIALCCLEGSTMSNLVHRRRRCARIVTYMILLPGGQYAAGHDVTHSALLPGGQYAAGPDLITQRNLSNPSKSVF